MFLSEDDNHKSQSREEAVKTIVTNVNPAYEDVQKSSITNTVYETVK